MLQKEPESLAEQLTGRREPTQFGRIMEELGIISITSLSPQARGRIERLWGTFQDRLKSELRIADAKTKEEANRVLWDFLPRFNPRFAVPAREPGLAYRQVPDGFKPDEVFCFKYQRTVGKDNVVRFGEHRLQIMPTNGRLSYNKAKVEVHERMDGSLAVYYKGQCLASKPAPPEAPVLRARNTTRVTPNMPIVNRETFCSTPFSGMRELEKRGNSPSPNLSLQGRGIYPKVSGESYNSDEVPAPVITTRKILESKAHHHTKPSPNHPWRRPFKIHIARG